MLLVSLHKPFRLNLTGVCSRFLSRAQQLFTACFSFAFLRISLPIWISGLLLGACSYLNIEMPPRETVECKIQAYTDGDLVSYLSDRNRSHLMTRLAVMPFVVPVTFSSSTDPSLNLGRDLAAKFQSALLATNEIPIVERFDIDRWPGRAEEFAAGNATAISLARNAGFDLVLIGQVDPIVNEQDMMLQTKLIDVANGVTLWFGKTIVTSHAREDRSLLSRADLVKNRPELFAFPERIEQMAPCTVRRMISGPELPED